LLKKAFYQNKGGESLIHHSIEGYSIVAMYTGQLKRRGIKVSMTEENHCCENAIAERVNGILKDEFYLDQCFSTTDHAA
jgi:putative transposase